MRKAIIFFGFSLGLIGGLTACQSTPLRQSIDDSLTEAKTSVKTAKLSLPEPSPPPRIWINKTPIKLSSNLPDVFDEIVSFQKPNGISLGQLVRYISDIMEIPTRFDRTLPKQASKSGEAKIAIEYPQGTAKGLLDQVASEFDVAWHYEAAANTIVFSETVTEQFSIAALPVSTDVQKLTVTNQATSSSGGESTPTPTSSHTATVTINQNFWSELVSTVGQLLSPVGRLSASPTTGLLTISDRPTALTRVRGFVRQLNKKLSRQAVFRVRILSVQQNQAQNAGINWNAVWTKLNDSSIAFATDRGAISGQGSLTASILSTSTSPWAGTQLFVDALATQGDVSEVTNTTVVAMHNQLAPLNVGQNEPYLRSIQLSASTTTGNTGTSASGLEPGTETVGFSMMLLASIVSDSRLLVQLAISKKTLLELRQLSSGGQTLEFPRVSNVDTIIRTSLKSGQTLMLTGYERQDDSRDNQGLAKPNWWWLGGRKADKRGRTSLVILITPEVIT